MGDEKPRRIVMRISCIDNHHKGRVCWCVEGESTTLCGDTINQDQPVLEQQEVEELDRRKCEGCASCHECHAKLKKIKEEASRMMIVEPDEGLDITTIDFMATQKHFRRLVRARIKTVEGNIDGLEDAALSMQMAREGLTRYLDQLKKMASILESTIEGVKDATKEQARVDQQLLDDFEAGCAAGEAWVPDDCEGCTPREAIDKTADLIWVRDIGSDGTCLARHTTDGALVVVMESNGLCAVTISVP
jgi:hypothetical protein